MENNKKLMFFYFLSAILFIYPLLSAGIYYRDDLDRAVTGFYGWTPSGRPLASVFLQFISTSGDKIADIFPYNIFICAAALAGCAYLIHTYLEKNGVSHSRLIASLVMFNPFFLQNVAYRFDGPAMSAGLFLAVYAYLHARGRGLRGFFISVAALVASISFYQTDANIFIALISLSMLSEKRLKDISSLMRELAYRCGQFILSYVIYMLTVVKVFAEGNNRNEFINLSSDGLVTLHKTILRMADMISSYMTTAVMIFFFIPIVVGLFFFIKDAVKERNLKLSILKLLISLMAFLVSLMGPSIVLLAAPVAPRTFVSFGILSVMIGVLVSKSSRIYLVSIIPAIAAFSFSAQLGNAIKAQRQYETNVMYSIRDDLRSINDIKDVRFAGQLNLSPVSNRIVQNSPLTNYFVSPASEWLAAFQLHEAGVSGVYLGYGKEVFNKNLIKKSNGNVIARSYDYIIYRFNNTAIVELGRFKI